MDDNSPKELVQINKVGRVYKAESSYKLWYSAFLFDGYLVIRG
jgi:hypothetical protein